MFKITCSNCTVVSDFLSIKFGNTMQCNKSFGPDPYTIEDPARIASKLRNRSARPGLGRAGPVEKNWPGLGPGLPPFGPARLTPLNCISTELECYFKFNSNINCKYVLFDTISVHQFLFSANAYSYKKSDFVNVYCWVEYYVLYVPICILSLRRTCQL